MVLSEWRGPSCVGLSTGSQPWSAETGGLQSWQCRVRHPSPSLGQQSRVGEEARTSFKGSVWHLLFKSWREKRWQLENFLLKCYFYPLRKTDC